MRGLDPKESQKQNRGPVTPSEPNDPHRWLEDLASPDGKEWARVRTVATSRRYGWENGRAIAEPALLWAAKLSPLIQDSSDKLCSLLSADEDFVYRIFSPPPRKRGVWQRRSLSQLEPFKEDQWHVHWEDLLDLDELSIQEGKNFFLASATQLKGKPDHWLIQLSEDGLDATELREWSLPEKKFVAGGFYVPRSRLSVVSLDADHLLVASSIVEPTKSGFATQVRLLTRGKDFTHARLLYKSKGAEHRVSVSSVTGSGADGIVLIESYGYDQARYAWATMAVGVPSQPEGIEVSFQHSWHNLDWLWLDQVPTHLEWCGATDSEVLFLSSKTTEDGEPAGSVFALSRARIEAGDRDVSLRCVWRPTEGEVIDSIRPTLDSLFLQMMIRGQTSLRWGQVIGDELRMSSLNSGGVPLNTVYVPELEVTSWKRDILFWQESSFAEPPRLRVTSLDARRLSDAKEPFPTQPSRALTKVLQAERALDEELKIVVTQKWVMSRDGTQIPYWCAYDAERVLQHRAGELPTWILGYGGFQLGYTPKFNSLVSLGWFAYGGQFLLPSLRGGGEFGPAWHQSARRENKQRSYDDLIAVLEDQVASGISVPSKMAIEGRSNGGLLVGNVFTQRPDLLGAAICGVPLLDMLRFDDLLAGELWKDEYGDPKSAKDREHLLQISPYHQLRAGVSYPPLLLYTSSTDDRVHPGHARKFAARLQELGQPVEYYEPVAGGHAGAAGSVGKLELASLRLSFLHRHLLGR